jgi:hypothetical protein
MDLRRGLFRLWVVGAVLFAAVVIAANYSRIRREFDEADWVTVKFVKCTEARGTAGRDYREEADKSCMYELDAYKRLYPEEGAALQPDPPPSNPWHTVGETVAIALGVPIGTLALGCALAWAFAGFRRRA